MLKLNISNLRKEILLLMEEMYFYVIVLERDDLHEKLLSELSNAGISNSTSINSVSMESSLASKEDSHIIAALRAFMTADRVESKTVFGVCAKDKLKAVHGALTKVAGNLNETGAATIAAFPVTFADGFYRTAKVTK